MARTARFALVALAALVALMLAADLLLTRAVDGEAGREFIQAQARALLEREVDYEGAEVSLLRAAVVVKGWRIESLEEGSPPLLEAEQLSVAVELIPLLSRQVVISSVKAFRPTVRLTRTAEGIALPISAAASEVDVPAPEEEGGWLVTPPVLLALDDVRVELADRLQAPPAHYVLEGVDATWRFGWQRGDGEVEIDGSSASLRVRERRYAAAGEELRLAARLVPGESVPAFEDLVLEVGSFRGDGWFKPEPSGRAELAGRFELPRGELSLKLTAEQAGGVWQLALESETNEARVEHALEALWLEQKAIAGALELDVALAAELLADTSPVDTLHGNVTLGIAPGEMLGVSILSATLRSLDRALGRGLLERLPVAGPKVPLRKGLDEHDTEEIESLSASFAISRGVARTHELLLVTKGYTFTMRGAIHLAGLGLDAVGELRLGTALTQALAGQLGMKKLPLMRELVIPIPRLGGTVMDPDPELDVSVIWRLVTGQLPGAGVLQGGTQEAGQLLRQGGEGAGQFFRKMGDRIGP